MKEITLPSSCVILPVSFLALFQLLVACLSVTPIGFIPNLLLSLIVSATLSLKIATTFTKDIPVRIIELLFITALSALSTYLFLLSINGELYDFTCSTGLLGSITQVIAGNFPVSYLSFSDLPMNYHQSSILLTGLLAGGLKIPVAAALKLFLGTLFFFLNISVALFFLQLRNVFYFLPIILFVTATSLSSNLYSFLGLGALPTVSVFRFSNSNSWPLALLLMTTLFFTLAGFNNSKKHILYVGLLILSLATINAMAFQFLTLCLFLSLMLYYLYRWHTKTLQQTKNTEVIFVVVTLLTLIPKFIPSAFALGALYASPELEIRFLAFTFPAYIRDILQYIMLTGLLPLLTLIISTPTILRKAQPLKQILYLLLLVSFFFPFVFAFRDLYEWHALHKIAVFCIFISIILITLEVGSLKKFRFVAGIVIILSILTSTQVIYSHTHELLSDDFSSFNYPDPEIEDVVTFLSAHKTLLIPYKLRNVSYVSLNIFCEETKYSEIAQYSGNFLSDAYDTTFLLDKQFEAQYIKEASWENLPDKLARVRVELDAGATLIVDKSLLTPEERLELESYISGTATEFSEYILYRTVPW